MSDREERKKRQLKPYKMDVDYSLLDEAMRKMGATPDTRPLPKPKSTPAVKLRKPKFNWGGKVGPENPKVIERPTFNELDIGMPDPDRKGGGIFYPDIPMTPKQEAEFLRMYGTDFIDRAGPKGFKKRKRIEKGSRRQGTDGMKKGGKVRGAGIARKGVKKCKMR